MEDKQTQEVEKRALLDRSEYEAVRSKLLELGATDKGTVSVEDVYFCNKEVKSFSEIEMNDVGSFSLRLRRQSVEGASEETIMNVKIITKENDHNSWEEHETSTKSLEESSAILKAIGFKPFCTIIKTRDTYTLDGVDVILENIQDFGLGVEAEIITTKDKGDEAKAKIDEILSRLGIDNSKIVKKSITNIIMHERAQF
ncbi:MAG: CYTH domain-containing protein [Candidatus Parvarchaeum sp.]